jgi:hypothetical protein
VFVAVAVDVGTEQVDQEWGQEDVSDGGGGFRGAEFEFAGDFVQGSGVGVDEDAAVVQFAVGPAQSGEFAPAHAGVGGGDDQHSVGGVEPGGDLVDLRGRRPGPFRTVG